MLRNILLAIAVASAYGASQNPNDPCTWGEWTECSVSCAGGLQTRTRVGAENCPEKETVQLCNTQECPYECKDVPGWLSSTNEYEAYTCQEYEEFKLCTPEGEPGEKWLEDYGPITDWGINGVDPLEGCCACGREKILCTRANIECLNGGTCRGGECFCVNGYRGDRCQFDPCDQRKMAVQAQADRGSWMSPEGPSCGIDYAEQLLAPWQCKRDPLGCNILSCITQPPASKFEELKTAQC